MIRGREIRFTKRPAAAAPLAAPIRANGHARPLLDPEVLKPHPLVALLPPHTLEQLLAAPALAEYPKGTVVFRAGDPCEALFLIISGRCEARAESAPPGLPEVEEVFGPGDVLGERALLSGEPHRSTVIVATACLLLRIPSRDLHVLFESDPSIAGRFTRSVADRLRIVRDREASGGALSRRVVSLYPLAARADLDRISQALGVALRALTRQRVLLVHIAPSETTPTLAEWPTIERTLNGGFCFRQQVREHAEGVDELRLGVNAEGRCAASVAPLLSHCSQHYDFVVLHVTPETPPTAAAQCMIQADLAFVLLQSAMQNLYDFDLLMRQLADHGHGADSSVKPILLADDETIAREAEGMLRDRGHPVHMVMRNFPTDATGSMVDRRFGLNINRLAREIARRRVGIAFSSGGAKGLAHIGIIQVLEENGVEIDVIAGASMGAYVGAIWAYGLDGGMLEKIAREHESRWGLWGLVDPVVPPRQGFMRTGRVIRRLRRSIGTAQFSELLRPLRVVATHLDTLERVVFSSGDVAEAVAASIAIPGVVVPVQLGGETYIDGGIADPLPVDVLEEMGIERIIAVNVIPPPEKLRQWLDHANEPDGRAPHSPKLRDALSRRINYFAHGNILDTMLQAVTGAQTRVAEAAAIRAHLLLRPLACDASWHDFTNPSKYIALGRAAAEEQLSDLKALTLPPRSHATQSIAPIAERAA